MAEVSIEVDSVSTEESCVEISDSANEDESEALDDEEAFDSFEDFEDFFLSLVWSVKYSSTMSLE